MRNKRKCGVNFIFIHIWVPLRLGVERIEMLTLTPIKLANMHNKSSYQYFD